MCRAIPDGTSQKLFLPCPVFWSPASLQFSVYSNRDTATAAGGTCCTIPIVVSWGEVLKGVPISFFEFLRHAKGKSECLKWKQTPKV